MLRRHTTALRLSLMAADAAVAGAVFMIVSVLRFGDEAWVGVWQRVGVEPIVAGATFATAWVSAMWLIGLYRLRARLTIRSEAIDLLRAGVLVAMVTFAALYVFKLPQVSRLFLVALFPTQLAVTFIIRLTLQVAFARARARGLNQRYVLVVGTGPSAQSFADRIERHRELGLTVSGHLELEPEGGADVAGSATPGTGQAVTRPILGRVDDIEDVLHALVIDEVAICLPPVAWGLVEVIARLCEDEGKVVRIPLTEGVLSLPGARHEEFDGIQMLSLVYGPDRAVGLVAKRIIDVTLSAAALVVLSPLLAAIALTIRLVDGPPILFRQTRLGLHGRRFEVVKFRSMVPDAEDRLEELLSHNEINGQAFKVTADPRLSRTGRWLRRTSVDELPQLVNVLKGEMSLVGPRPPLPREVADYDVWHRRRLSMKPGITGLWQVSARREEEFDRWVEMDLDYIDRWSLWLDLKIMVRTIPAMLQGR